MNIETTVNLTHSSRDRSAQNLEDAVSAVIAEPESDRSILDTLIAQDASIENLSELHPGTPLVHLEQGVGLYAGLTRLNTGAVDNEFLTLTYRDDEKLYVPVASMHLLSRVSFSGDKVPTLHALGSAAWLKIRRSALKGICETAFGLDEAFRDRQARTGIAFRPDIARYVDFCSDFAHKLTADQQRTMQEVLSDLWSSQPMDRVVCGDVGFGKTEIAMRAAFVAAETGRQVAILAPTTLLAHQHYLSFIERFKDQPFHIELLSRASSQVEQRSIVEALAEGQIDIVIGTQRLLSKRVDFADLGLAIVDEEHRFGVRHKRKLSRLRRTTGSLSLSATPIPRTMGLAIAGLRDLSIIKTPPPGRQSVETVMAPWNDLQVRSACEREVGRGGQVYILHDRVRTMESFTDYLCQVMPTFRIAYAHGKMSDADLQAVIQEFKAGHFDILVTSTIIESGIDIPAANTLIVDRADRLGLAQLHQIRGRVGRSTARAYALLTTPADKPLGALASQRLQAICDLPSLGAGEGLAAHDLELRGAGELLGGGQTGHIEAVGFALYNELLGRAVSTLREGRTLDASKLFLRSTIIDTGSVAVLPESYLPDTNKRLDLYRRLSRVRDIPALEALKTLSVQCHGELPEQASRLFRVTGYRVLCDQLKINSLQMSLEGGCLHVQDVEEKTREAILGKVKQHPAVYQLTTAGDLVIDRVFFDEARMLNFFDVLLRELVDVSDTGYR